jgi:hypothetical protein
LCQLIAIEFDLKIRMAGDKLLFEFLLLFIGDVKPIFDLNLLMLKKFENLLTG